MKTLTQKQEKQIKALESKGDELVSNPSFDNCMKAIDAYVKAQEMLLEYANDKDALNEYGELKTTCLEYKVWYDDLIKKMNTTQHMLLDSRIVRK